MLLNCDVKSLEVVTAAELSGDKILKQEIRDKVDIHDENRRAFGLGDGKPGRLVAKIFKFRMLFGGTAWSYANDPDFTGVSDDFNYWQRVIDLYYEKYSGIKRWHDSLLNQVKLQGFIEIPSGRYYPFKPTFKYGEWKWPHTQIKNYPVQGFGADLVMLARIAARKKIKVSGLQADLIQTIHDSIVVDTPQENVYNIGIMLKQAVEEVPALCKKWFNYDFSLPLTCEIQVGPNKRDMKELTV